jgi:hypothetical protein
MFKKRLIASRVQMVSLFDDRDVVVVGKEEERVEAFYNGYVDW